jgi:hypothetical protein
MARMAAVCDVYDAVTSNRPYKKAAGAADTMSDMFSWRGHFDDKVMAAFIRSVGIYPVGSLVRLHSDRLGLVTDQCRSDLTRPKLRVFYCIKTRTRIQPYDLDLLRDRDGDRIVSREDPMRWGFAAWDTHWTDLIRRDLAPVARVARGRQSQAGQSQAGQSQAGFIPAGLGWLQREPLEEFAMRAFIPLLIAAAATAFTPAAARERLDPEAEIARAVAGRVAGEPVDCVDMSRVQSTRIIDNTAIIYDAGSILYVNRPRAGAESLDRWDTLLTELHSSRLCSIDTVRLLDSSTRFQNGFVFLGEFVPYRRVRTGSAN